MNNPCITSTRVMTRDGYAFQGTVTTIADRHEQSERQRLLAAVARIEARLELERALQRGPVAMATPTPIARRPGAMATRNPGKIHPAPLRDSEAGGFDRTDRIMTGVCHSLLIIAIAMVAAVLLGGAA